MVVVVVVVVDVSCMWWSTKKPYLHSINLHCVVVVLVVVVYICKCDGGGCSYGVGLPIAMWCLSFHTLAQILYGYFHSRNCTVWWCFLVVVVDVC